ncbi:hypothetical protein AAG570_008906 [Ranatra chinensis]|uniref:CWH43-like N-terminal domain-containing protein n=1 Tax=Ranatra chinensis TaxID=642074 RepID=A0ABD0YUE8_9HEMI
MYAIPHIFECITNKKTYISRFIVAVKLDHVSPIFPYISDTGAFAPESCIFSLLLNVISILLAGCVYIRHLQVSKFANFRYGIDLKLKVNKIATYFGFFSCLGMSMVGNFQDNNVWEGHYIGALLCFVGGTIYFIFQTVFSYHMSKLFNSKCVFYSRCILCTLSVIFDFIAIIPGVFSKMEYTGHNSNHWKRSEGGWLWHIVSAGGEWMLAFCESALVLTFLPEFKPITIYSPVLKVS